MTVGVLGNIVDVQLVVPDSQSIVCYSCSEKGERAVRISHDSPWRLNIVASESFICPCMLVLVMVAYS